jgi:hypothetical protein
MTAEVLLSKLDKVRKTGPDSWVACCPAHQDKSPSMTVKDLPDGRVLIHCFAECATAEILGAVGLGFDALFPPKPLGERVPPVRKPYPAADALELLAHESLVVLMIAADMQDGKPIDRARLVKAAARIQKVRDAANG